MTGRASATASGDNGLNGDVEEISIPPTATTPCPKPTREDSSNLRRDGLAQIGASVRSASQGLCGAYGSWMTVGLQWITGQRCCWVRLACGVTVSTCHAREPVPFSRQNATQLDPVPCQCFVFPWFFRYFCFFWPRIESFLFVNIFEYGVNRVAAEDSGQPWRCQHAPLWLDGRRHT